MQRTCLDTLEQLRRRLRDALAQSRSWQELPGLMDELDALRRAAEARAESSARGLSWAQRFAGELRQQRHDVDADHAFRAARELMPWLGAYDPVALARGRWVDLPKSYG